MLIKTSDIPSTAFSSKIIDGDYCKVVKSGTLLTISYARLKFNSYSNTNDYNILTFTNLDNTTCELKFQTAFSINAGTDVWVTTNIPLNYKSVTLVSADDGGEI